MPQCLLVTKLLIFFLVVTFTLLLLRICQIYAPYETYPSELFCLQIAHHWVTVVTSK